MNGVLDRLIKAHGIGAAAVFLSDPGTTLAAGAPTMARQLETLARRMAHARATDDSFAARAGMTVVRCEQGTLVVRRNENATLVVLGAPDLDMSTAGAGFHIAVAFKVIGMRASRRPPMDSRAPMMHDARMAEMPAPAPLPKL